MIESLFNQATEIVMGYQELYERWFGVNKFRNLFDQWYLGDVLRQGNFIAKTIYADQFLADLYKIPVNLGCPIVPGDISSVVVCLMDRVLNYGTPYKYKDFLALAEKDGFIEEQTWKIECYVQKANNDLKYLHFYELLSRFDYEDRDRYFKLTRKYYLFIIDNAAGVDKGKISTYSRLLASIFNDDRDVIFYVPDQHGRHYVDEPISVISPSYSSLGSSKKETASQANAVSCAYQSLRNWLNSNPITDNYIGKHGELDRYDESRRISEDIQQFSNSNPGADLSDHYHWEDILDAETDGYLDD